MKRKTLLLLGMLGLSGSLAAQHTIDLRQTEPPVLHYLNMGHAGPTGQEIRVNNLYMERGRQPWLPVMGEAHFSRMDARYWRDTLLKMKSSGIDIVATYVIWSLHEEFEGKPSWEGNLNLRRFLELCREVGLKVHLRIGPYCNAEIHNGGLPAWIVGNRQLKPRSNDPLYLAYTRKWYQEVYGQVKGLLHKDGGPVMAVQLENEYVTSGQIIPHLTTLKQMATETGFDVPLYTMTHWMSTEYPRGEIVPYAGFYLEAPWCGTGKDELPVSDFEFFTYNRIADNIGTDIIKTEGKIESLGGKGNDSPFFTCEVGVGTTAFYYRRAVVDGKMAGQNINLRLGCGANLMGYYMYAGGTNPVGQARTTQSSGPRVSYDYQAPIREYGTLGRVMPETKKYNFFMNDFGRELAPAVAYLPTENRDRRNLQWAVREHAGSGYLFCSNILYRRSSRPFADTRFEIKLKGETICMPRRPATIAADTYFHWPFNLKMGRALMKYATLQPVCTLTEGKTHTYFFFEDDGIAGEILLSRDGIRRIKANRGTVVKEADAYFIHDLHAGTDCTVEAVLDDGTRLRIVVLTAADSDCIWKGRAGDREYVALTQSALVCDGRELTLIDESPTAEVSLFRNGKFEKQTFQTERTTPAPQVEVRSIPPFDESRFITPCTGQQLLRTYTLASLASIQHAWLRWTGDKAATCTVNGQTVKPEALNGYNRADVRQLVRNGSNELAFTLSGSDRNIVAEVELLLTNGQRIVWPTDATWTASDLRTPARPATGTGKPAAYAPEEHLALYALSYPTPAAGDEETRLYLKYRGDVGNAYIGGKLAADSYFDGTAWIIGLCRLPLPATGVPLVIRIDGLHDASAPIYFEKGVDTASLLHPRLDSADIRQEYRFRVAY